MGSNEIKFGLQSCGQRQLTKPPALDISIDTTSQVWCPQTCPLCPQD